MTVDDPMRLRGRHLWAKSAEVGEGHSLLAHLLDVGLTADELLHRRNPNQVRTLAAELGIEDDAARRLLVIMSALHDVGKATPCFQAKWPAGAPPEALAKRVADVPHGRAGGILLGPWLRERGVRPRLATSLANAVAIHHGQRLPQDFAGPGTYDPRSIAEDESPWQQWRSALIEDVFAAFGPFPELTHKKSLRSRSWALLAGLTSVADWIGSSLSHVGTVHDVAEYLASRRPEVQERLDEISWPRSRPWWQEPGSVPSFSYWFGSEFEPRPLQREVEALAGGFSEQALYLIEAPMGEGKTEAAFFSLVQPHGIEGAYVALPTQATSDAMHARLLAFTEANRGRSIDIALAHSTAHFLPSIQGSVPVSLQVEREAKAEAETWFSTGRRELLAELGVGTVDQALLGALPTRHFFVRLWGLAGKVVVFDEVHAYDAYTESLVAELVRWLAAIGSSVVLMSATLPKASSSRITQAFYEGLGEDSPPSLPSLEYPRALRASATGIVGKSFSATRMQNVAVREAPFNLELLAAELVSALENGAAVAAIVNTVGRAQALYKMCRSLSSDVHLVHARFPLSERKRREADIVARFGPNDKAQRGAGLVVATQVLEQSLDLDFDVLYTDLAPIDLMLQRAGRMHRHEGRRRPQEYSEPLLYVNGLFDSTGTKPEPEALDSVYQTFIVLRTWAALQGVSQLRFPQDIDELVQLVYGNQELPALADLASELDAAAREYNVEQLTSRKAAEHWALGSPLRSAVDSWGEPGRDEDDWRQGHLRIPTRLGADSVNVVPVTKVNSGWTVWNRAEHQSTSVKRASGKFVNAAASQQIRVSRKSLVAKLRTQDIPDWWAASGGLRRLYPLVLDQGGKALIDPSIRLDDELGLVYEKGVTS